LTDSQCENYIRCAADGKCGGIGAYCYNFNTGTSDDGLCGNESRHSPRHYCIALVQSDRSTILQINASTTTAQLGLAHWASHAPALGSVKSIAQTEFSRLAPSRPRVSAVEKGATARLAPLGTALRGLHAKETPALQKPPTFVHNQTLCVRPHFNAPTACAEVLVPRVPSEQEARPVVPPTVQPTVSAGRRTRCSTYVSL
jgi:hypothetical protein